MDDIIITGDDEHAVDLLVQNLAKRFSLKDLGSLIYFLGMEIQSHPHRLVLSQHKYIQDLLHCTNMSNSRPMATPLPPGPPPTLAMGELLPNPSAYHATVGSLQYMSLTRPDLSFAVNKLS
jgi:histone deacetylase 1/2